VKLQKINIKLDAEKTISTIKKYGSDNSMLILDSYALSEQWENSIKPYVQKLIVIDDQPNRSHNCDLLIDQNLSNDHKKNYGRLLPKKTKKLLGPKFAMIRKEFKLLRHSAKIRTFPIENIFVSFGGTDIDNQSIKILNLFQKIGSNLHFDVVVGNGNKNKKIIKNLCSKNKNFSYHEQINYVGRLMLKSDLAIGSSGSTAWERCCLGLPSIISISAKNQKNIANELSKRNCVINLGSVKQLEGFDYKTSIDKISKHHLERMSKNSLKLVDGNGTKRILKYILDMSVRN
jgi:UDP-2,4-diacetamido-2,4,6-trideoxy-beta-L-altropyranose hydrolase